MLGKWEYQLGTMKWLIPLGYSADLYLPIFLPDSRRKTCSLLSFSGDPRPGFGTQWNKSGLSQALLSGPLPFRFMDLLFLSFSSQNFPTALEALTSPLWRPTWLEASLLACGSLPSSKPTVVHWVFLWLCIWLCFCHHFLLWLLLSCFHFHLLPLITLSPPE